MPRSFLSFFKFNITHTSRMITLLLTNLLLLPCLVYGEINIDGLTDESEWKNAQVFRDFTVIDPWTLENPRLSTETRVVSLPEGLAVAFICEQPPEEIRTRTITMHDQSSFDSDYVSLMIDFDGTRQVAYEFSVSIAGSYRDGIITRETSFSYDWDGIWKRAVHEDTQQWTVEILLPWSIVAMREGDGKVRQMAVCFQRFLNSRTEKFSFPAISASRAVFKSEFTKIEVTEYREQQLDISPYVTVLSDLVKNSTKGKAGLDLFWKPSSNFQLAATANPDFGQVESDDLVINFSTTETFFSDKRPFFAENQGIFSMWLPMQSYIIHTRRIGAESDDSGKVSDIDGAVKVIGSAGPINYGILAAQENGDAGRSFYAGRVQFPEENWSVGVAATYTKRPFINRTALVNTLDYTFKQDRIIANGRLLISDIDEDRQKKTGHGGYTTIEYMPSDRWRIRAEYTRYGDKLDINDMGYLNRNNYYEKYLYGEWRQTDFTEDSRTAEVTWMGRIINRKNLDGMLIHRSLYFDRNEKLLSGSEIDFNFMYLFPAYDDLISRGSGPVYLNDRLTTNLSYSTQRRGIWRKSFGMSVFQEGYDNWATSLSGSVSLYPNENITVDLTVKPLWSRDWLIWVQDDKELASFSRRQLSMNFGTSWFPAERHEVRFRAQWLVIDADLEQTFRIGPASRLVPSNDAIDNFAALNFGLQLRYRYEIAPLSNFYVVYSRGGLDYIYNQEESTLGLFRESTSLRKSDQILFKLSYRF